MDSSFSAKVLIFYTAPDFPNTIDNTANKQTSDLRREIGEPRFLRRPASGHVAVGERAQKSLD
jgi:hypothetical protein